MTTESQNSSEWDPESNNTPETNRILRTDGLFYQSSLIAASGWTTTPFYTMASSSPTVPYSIEIEFKNLSWRYTLSYAFGWIMMPFMVIISKLLHKKFKLGML